MSQIPEHMKEIGAGVYQTVKPVSFISRVDIEWLKAQALETNMKRARICLHQHPEDPVHEMIIAVHKTSFISPHYHPHKEESLHLIEGVAEVLLFSDEGNIADIKLLEARNKNGVYFYRIAKNIIHGLRLKSDWIIFHEVAAGPLRPDANQIPKWVPEFKEAQDGIDWVSRL